MPLFFLLLLVLFCNTQANQFLGTVMTYYPKTTNADGSVLVGVRYELNFQSCTDLRWQCLSGNCGNESVVNYVSMNSTGDWCQTEGISTRQVPSNAPFELWLNGSSWIDNITNGIVNWRAVTLVELRNRSDTGQANASPQTTILPTVRVPSNCQRDLNLLAFDPDGDDVQCRNGNTSLSECNPCTPPPVLSLSLSCTLSFSPTNGSNEGPYAVQLVMEDFPRKTITLTQANGTQITLTTSDAISKIPVQFVFWVDPVVPSCTEGLYLPQFLPPTPTNGAQLYTPVNQTLEINIKADANISTVSEILFSGPYNIVQNTSGSGQFTLSWTPSEREDRESFPVCFAVKAVLNVTTYQSNLRCVIVNVRSDPTISTTVSTNSTPSLNFTEATTAETSTVNSTAPPPTNNTDTTPNTADTSAVNSTAPPPTNNTDTTPNTADTSAVNSTAPPPTNHTDTTPNTADTSAVNSTAPPPTNHTDTTPNTADTSTVNSTAPPPTNNTDTTPNIIDTNTPATTTTDTSPFTSPPPPPNTTVMPPIPSSTASFTTTSTTSTQMTNSPTYVVGLSVRVSSLVSLSSINIESTLQQVQNALVQLGLPSALTIQIVSIVQQ